tara:strand:- start:1292 stop:1414 length:123 start_codon:yes stop_codon:yes gene_type:complete
MDAYLNEMVSMGSEADRMRFALSTPRADVGMRSSLQARGN